MAEDIIKTVREKLGELTDEETTRRFKELNIIADVAEAPGGILKVRFTPLSPYSPIAVDIGRMIRTAALSVVGVTKVAVECSGHMSDDLVNRLVNKED